ncbi:hypothetical protein AVEN_89542-1 [Araneus ventricosus]|uniref:Uncharacterized protein n=1 Tax=Araneus ventricosus TaxID=182803 RepID=A0A4Y2L4Z1_ARAVE|nr:hypothetical protein AVEN_89542-1 [Araneus ventricosus]
MTTLSSIGYVAHVHCFRYENGLLCPAEIGVVQVLPLGIPDHQRKTLLVTVNNSDLKMHLADWRANVVVSDKISKLPTNFVGESTRAEAEQRVRDFIPRGSLVATKGLEEKRYFQGLGLHVVELKTEVMPQCPKHKDLPSHFKHLPLRLWHSGNHNDCCSRAIALGFARFIEWQVLADESKQTSLSQPKQTNLSEPSWDDLMESIDSMEPKQTSLSQPKQTNFSEPWWDDFMDSMEPKQTSLSQPKQLSEPQDIFINVKRPAKIIINVM